MNTNTVAQTDEREKDIQNLCLKVLNATPHTFYNPNGADETTCPFCHAKVHYAGEDIGKLPHNTDCAYLVAKDLSTNHI